MKCHVNKRKKSREKAFEERRKKMVVKTGTKEVTKQAILPP